MKTPLLLASTNPGKLAEFRQLLPGVDWILWPEDAPALLEPGAFFHDNALQKVCAARDWWRSHRTQQIAGALADDSGLCVDALWGGPGVLSARFAPSASPDERNRRLLALLPEGAPRTARFVCVLAFAPMESRPWTVSGSVEGRLAEAPSGTNGFGYDPIFIPEGFDRTFGELPPSVKHSLSHRGRACAALAERLEIQLARP